MLDARVRQDNETGISDFHKILAQAREWLTDRK